MAEPGKWQGKNKDQYLINFYLLKINNLIMKKLTTITIALTFMLFAKAQLNPGIKTGLTLANQNRVDHEDYYDQSTKAKTKFHIGVFADMKIIENIYAQPGIMFTGKGAEHTSSYSGTKTDFIMSYMDLPLNVVYKYPLSFGKIYGGGGPLISFATGGKIEQKGKTKKMFGDSNDDYKRGDFGLNLLAGVELSNGIIAGISYQTGFADIYKHEAAKIKNRTFNVSVGYLLKRGN
ncbi:MAG: porin family protein [Chitinophagaceae bacterium]|nr:MAG: porin family protein [Chitinophagaceae bacterium]